MENPFHYRNKVMSPFAAGKKLPRPSGAGNGGFAGKRRHARLDREVLTGMYEPHSHRLVPTDGCLIENEEANRIVATIARLMGRFGIPPYKEGTGAGFLRHAVIRVGHESGEIIVTLVTNGDDFPNARAFCRELVKIHPAITTVVQNVNERDTNVVLGERERTLYGPGFILDTLCGLTFRISSQSFYQVNSAQTEVLYRRAIELAGLDGTQTAIDAYCGTGTIGLVAARSGAARVVGVESVASAVRDARQNARHNGVENASFLCADAALLMRALAGGSAFAGRRGEEGATPFDVDDAVVRAVAEAGEMDPASCVLFLDPPRSGASKAFLEAASAFSPARIVYISCDPTTQARDAAFLERFGWRIEAVQPVDMFPHTDHIENIVAMSRSGATSKAR